jgi:hypothetical protein
VQLLVKVDEIAPRKGNDEAQHRIRKNLKPGGGEIDATV